MFVDTRRSGRRFKDREYCQTWDRYAVESATNQKVNVERIGPRVKVVYSDKKKKMVTKRLENNK